MVVNWASDGAEIRNFKDENGKVRSRPQNIEYCRKMGITWSLRPSKDGSFRVLPRNSIFSVMGSAAFIESSNSNEILCTLALLNSTPFNYLIGLLSSRGGEGSGQTKTYDVGCLSNSPVPEVDVDDSRELSELARESYFLQRKVCGVDEVDHSFILPCELFEKNIGSISEIKSKFISNRSRIDEIAYRLYGLNEDLLSSSRSAGFEECYSDDLCLSEGVISDNSLCELFSWAVGVSFGRFDIKVATGERQVYSCEDVFEGLTNKSPGMLQDSDVPLHRHSGILIDDEGHPHDLARLIEAVLAKVNWPTTEDVRRWLQRDFFSFHLQQYSKSRRKAPIYWPLATTSGGYTLWLYYPSLNDQALFTAVNDFVDPKIGDVRNDIETLRGKGASRTKQEEKDLETLTNLEHELADLRDSLLEIASQYRPNHDDGVQISAAPLWKLFRHKPWQKVLKDTWAKLEKGDYDWAHLAMNYWPNRVREKCITDKSLAIAHNLEHLYIESEPKPAKARGRAKKQDA